MARGNALSGGSNNFYRGIVQGLRVRIKDWNSGKHSGRVDRVRG